jgi:hypothetical protein
MARQEFQQGITANPQGYFVKRGDTKIGRRMMHHHDDGPLLREIKLVLEPVETSLAQRALRAPWNKRVDHDNAPPRGMPGGLNVSGIANIRLAQLCRNSNPVVMIADSQHELGGHGSHCLTKSPIPVHRGVVSNVSSNNNEISAFDDGSKLEPASLESAGRVVASHPSLCSAEVKVTDDENAHGQISVPLIVVAETLPTLAHSPVT